MLNVHWIYYISIFAINIIENFKCAFGLIDFKGYSRNDPLQQDVTVFDKQSEHLSSCLLLDLIGCLLWSIIFLSIICLMLGLLKKTISGDARNIKIQG